MDQEFFEDYNNSRYDENHIYNNNTENCKQ